jgi:hypothetical protein
MKTDRTHVPDKLYGYTVQIRYMMYELISLDLKKIVSTEALEDVAVESSTETIVEQIKSVQSSNNPVSERSSIFWKTLFNWFNYINNGELNINNTTFRLIVISNKVFSTGSIEIEFSEADTYEKAQKALKQAKESLWGKDSELKQDVPLSYKTYLDILFDPKNEKVFVQIITNMKIEIYTNNYDEILYDKFCGQLIPPEYSRELFIYMLGWVYECVNQYIKNGNPAYIATKDFRDALLLQVRRYDQEQTLSWVTLKPDDIKAKYEIERQDTYIKQLDIINLDIPTKLKAASDFLRTSAEKTIWADRGLIAPQSFNEYYEDMERIWENISNLVLISRDDADEVLKGQKIYFRCQDSVKDKKVQGKNVPLTFNSGSLHVLANEQKIGWHPQFKIILKITKEEKDAV